MSRANAQPKAVAFTSLVLEIFRTNGRLLRAGDELTRNLGITSARWQVLGAIARAPCTVAQIAREYEMTRQGALWIVRALLQDELVELVHNPDHKRAKLVRLTAKGSNLLHKVLQRQQRWATRLSRHFTAEELRVGGALVERLGELVAVDRGDGE